ncbi:MAG: lysophospholipid acyltransferase family protein [Bacteroidota bacterium]
MMKFLRAFIRFILFILLSLGVVIQIMSAAWVANRGLAYRLNIRRKWADRMTRILGLRIQMEGRIPEGPCLLVGNHRSYIDPVIILRDVLALPVAKSEVRKWPVVGIGAEVTGTLFVQRSNPQNRRAIRHQIAQTIKEKGYPIILYVEGTTHIEPTTIDFKVGMFVMAAREKLAVVPVAIDYENLDSAWIGDDTFVPHFFRTFGKPYTNLRISYGSPIYHKDFQQMVDLSKDWIDREMLRFRQEWR